MAKTFMGFPRSKRDLSSKLGDYRKKFQYVTLKILHIPSVNFPLLRYFWERPAWGCLLLGLPPEYRGPGNMLLAVAILLIVRATSMGQPASQPVPEEMPREEMVGLFKTELGNLFRADEVDNYLASHQ